MSNLKGLEAIPHSPAKDSELENYARGVVAGIMKSATPNVVGSLLARIRSMNHQTSIDNALMVEGVQKITELQDEVKRLKEHVKDLDHDLQASVNEANWQNRQGEEYGSY